MVLIIGLHIWGHISGVWGWCKTYFLLYWTNIYYTDSQVWASGFISKQKWTHFSWCWVSIFSPDPGLPVLSGRKSWPWQNNAERWPKKASEEHLTPPSWSWGAGFYVESPLFQPLNHELVGEAFSKQQQQQTIEMFKEPRIEIVGWHIW